MIKLLISGLFMLTTLFAATETYEEASKLYEDLKFKEAYAIFKPLCEEKKDIKSCGSLGTMYYYGDGVTTDKDKGLKLIQDACEKGDELSCESLEYTKEVEKMIVQCNNKNAEVCKELGNRERNYNLENAFVYFNQACKFGDERSCFEALEIKYPHQKYKNDMDKLYVLVKQKCDKENSALECIGFAKVLVKEKNIEGLKYYEKGCEAHYASACKILGFNYGEKFYRTRDNKDMDSAVSFTKKGCEYGDEGACMYYKRLLQVLSQ